MNHYLNSTFNWSDVKPCDTVTILSFEVTDEIYSKAIKVAYKISCHPVYHDCNGDLLIQFVPTWLLAGSRYIFESSAPNNIYRNQ